MKYQGKITDPKDLVTKEYVDTGLSGKQTKITASGVLIGNGSGGVTAKTLDTSSLTNDNNHVPTSGVVKSALTQLESDLASIHATGSTNTTGSKITAGWYFYLNDVLVQAKTDIAVNATFTSGTNYETVTAGALNKSVKSSSCTANTTVVNTPIYNIVSRCANVVSLTFHATLKSRVSGNGTLFATIPEGYRPTNAAYLWAVVVYNGTRLSVLLTIQTDGKIESAVGGGTLTDYVTLTGTYLVE